MTAAERLRLAVVVVTFHPEAEVLERLLGYARSFGHVVVVDNTEEIAALTPLHSVDHLTYVPLRENRGVAAALNVGIDRVRSMGYKAVLLLDQDSQALPCFVADALAFAAPGIGILAMTPVSLGAEMESSEPSGRVSAIEVPVAITSGSILALSAYDACGGFDERLFIDYVDTEYCLRLRRNGWRVARVPSALLQHALGAPRQVRIFGRTAHYVSHAPFRSYYRVRNGLYVVGKHFLRYPIVTCAILKVLAKELVKALFIEERRGTRLHYMLVGLGHWASGKYGRLPVTRGP